MEQNYLKEKVEIIVASDGSTDNTIEIAKQYKNKGKQVMINQNGNLPLVSFIIVARNAAEYLLDLFSDILIQDYPLDHLELLLIDGQSKDSTLYIMENFAKAHKTLNVKILDNPGKTLPCGWNVALAEARGDIILRVDAHSSIPSNFIRKNVDAILNNEDIVGGPIITKVLSGAWIELLAIAECSKFGSGVANFRNLGPPRYVDTLANAAYKRKVFETVGGHDERVVRTEDNEIHYRMKKAGFKFFFDPAIKSFRIPRLSLYGILKQKYGNGFWIGLTMGIQPRCFGIRHFIPFLFLVASLFFFALWIIWSGLPIALLSILYILSAVVFTIEAMIKAPYKIKPLCIALPIIFLLMHLAYGIGTSFGLLKIPFFVQKNCDYKISYPIKKSDNL